MDCLFKSVFWHIFWGVVFTVCIFSSFNPLVAMSLLGWLFFGFGMLAQFLPSATSNTDNVVGVFQVYLKALLWPCLCIRN